MFCKYCGNQIPDDSRFCAACGAKLIASEPTPVPEQAPEPTSGPQPAPAPQPTPVPERAPAPQPTHGAANDGPDLQQPRYIPPVQEGAAAAPQPQNKSKKGLIIGLAAGGGGLVVLLLLLFLVILPLIGGRKVEIDFTKYLSVSFEGYDTVGTATSSFDVQGFLDEYGEKIKYKKEYKDLTPDPAGDLLTYFSFEEPLDSNLSNGQEISCDLDFNPMMFERFNVKVAGLDDEAGETTLHVPFTVSGLEEVGLFDPFENMQVNFTGTSPFGDLEINTENCPEPVKNRTDMFLTDKNSDLANGDAVTISLDSVYDDEYFASSYGMIPSRTSMEYTVEGLNELVTKLSQISGSQMKSLRTACDKLFKERVIARNEGEIKNISYKKVGQILKVAKSPNAYKYDNNTLYLIYKDKSKIGNRNSVNMTHYVVMYFNNVNIDKDGKLVVDTDDVSFVSHSYSVSKGAWKLSGTAGFATLNDVKSELLPKKDSNYSYESSLK